ncbi:MAG: hypothetical protein JWL65_5156 [Gammaproteobacteria bacterium]|nr:hypothetical protein [Gammaproteobacteria bacterium]
MAAELRILRIFISYATEDLPIAVALARSLAEALGDWFAEINLDRWVLEAGEELKKQIKSTLERTDVFISLDTGMTKQMPAWEVGFFEALMDEGTKGRRFVPMFLDTVPSVVTSYQGVGLQISRAYLQLTPDQFQQLKIEDGDALTRFFEHLQQEVDEYRRAAGFPKEQRRPEQDPVRCIQRLRLAIFNYLQTTVREVFRPQKRLLIRTTTTALQNSGVDLPPEALLISAGQGNAMSTIFGLSDFERTWDSFLKETSGNEHAESWRAAIASVVISSSSNRVNVDNSRIVMANDNSTAYRVIVTSTTRYYDDKREWDLYFHGLGAPTVGTLSVQPYFGRPLSLTEPLDVFVLMPFAADLDDVYRDHISKVTSALGLVAKRGDDFFSAHHVISDIWCAIWHSRAIIADCSTKNPNVFYEIGVAHAIGKPVVLITQHDDHVPFDLRSTRYIKYEFKPRGMEVFESRLKSTLQTILADRLSLSPFR